MRNVILISQQKLERVFTGRQADLGLGLTIAKRNAELNGGSIEVQSERGVGTTVTMTLPIRRTTRSQA